MEISVPYELHSLRRSAGLCWFIGSSFWNITGEEWYVYDWCLFRWADLWSNER